VRTGAGDARAGGEGTPPDLTGASASARRGIIWPMTRKADFTADDWETLTGAPALAAAAIAAAERGGSVRESLALARMYAEARASSDHTELISALFSSPPALNRQDLAGQSAASVLDHAEAQVAKAITLLRERATERELREYGDFVVHLTQAVAEAHKEGGVLGIGGKPVSDAEHAALERIAYALGPRPGQA
jgi:hypothetical protein